ncbi:hypothetical protein TSTA_011080 [Talaromyces stipitatus ATCC 10500]|uniref:Transmembrane protein n=1 Tax=Talaromyces stipitatus (strain ATCC 10500 / CBS 375.48 / QM 6759 / NRRL 1006) TaxID=441959 RepID=B8MHL2_TALSN|nr:uncharacterized protein TSTA_011080 [Talaromyces stipitatus ATCC 10500]EED15993.1 hypothetical protein TSTA_011080 [Talaromyces stipitatus ATCC 10500]
MIWLRYLPRNPRYLRQCRAFTTGSTRIVSVPVRIRRPWFRRFATSVLAYGVAFHVWTTLVYLQLDGSTVSESASSGSPRALSEGRIIEGNGKILDDDEVEDASFIPLSWPRLRPGELYKGSDPEWKTFQEYARDKQKMDTLRKELQTLVLAKLSTQREFVHLLGGKPLRVSDSWLMVHCPYRAPPQYETLGLAIVDNEATLISKPIPREQGQLLTAALFPSAVASAVLAAGKVLWKRKVQRFKNYLGADEERSTKEAIMKIKNMDIQSDMSPSTNVSLQNFADWEKSLSSGAAEEINRSAASGMSDTTRSQPQPDTSRTPKILSLMQSLSSQYKGSDFYVAYLAFNLHFKRNRALQRKVPPRGVFYLSGPIGIKGGKGECRVEVRGEYDPAEKKWCSLMVDLKDLRPYNQSPLGYHRE